MKPISILLLELPPAGELGTDLRQIIETTREYDLDLKQEAMETPKTGRSLSGGLQEIIRKINPAVILLVTTGALLELVKSMFASLNGASPLPPLIVVTDENAPGRLFDLIRLGAADFITPPLTPCNILPRLWRLIEQTCRGKKASSDELGRLNGLIGESPSFLKAVEKIPVISRSDSTVFISGETGTGKEVCARTIHQLSGREDNKFFAVNCGALPVDLVESELFGHERGAFTGAVTSQPGVIRAAEGGTLFLDELDSLPLLAQVKLLRFLQDKEFRPIGSTIARQADVRVIAATNTDIESAVRNGRIRQDLYYRLNMIPIALPPLRERREDIPLLASHFLNRFAGRMQRHVSGFSGQAIRKLCLYDWPGNVRELECIVGRAVTFAESSVIQGSDITLPDTAPKSFQEVKREMVRQFERTYIQSLLIAYGGNITRAAEAAKKDRRSFFELIRKLGIDAERFKRRS